MNTTYAVLIFATVAVAGLGPFIAVKRGGDAYDFDDEPEPHDNDDTTQIPRVTYEADLHSY